MVVVVVALSECCCHGVTRDYALSSETGWRTDHERLRNLSQSAVSTTIFPSPHLDASFFHFTQPGFLPFSSFSFHPRALTLATTAAVHIHIKPHPRHATTAFDNAPSELPPTHTHYHTYRRQTQPRTPHTHAAAVLFLPPSLSPISCLASPRRTSCHMVPSRHASP